MLDAETEGMIGYLLELALRRCLPEREIATLLTQVEVSAEDAARPVGGDALGFRLVQSSQGIWHA